LQVQLVGGRGTGHLALLDLKLDERPGVALPEDSPLLARDWSRVLGLRLDEQGEVRPLAP
jgi:hypothetical protein